MILLRINESNALQTIPNLKRKIDEVTVESMQSL